MKIKLTETQIADAWMHHVAAARTADDLREEGRRGSLDRARELGPLVTFSAASARSWFAIATSGEIETETD